MMKVITTKEQAMSIMPALVFDMGMSKEQILSNLNDYIIRYSDEKNHYFFSDRVQVQMECTKCRELFCINIDIYGFKEYMMGKSLIQRTFPYLTDTERGCIIDRMCPECEDEMFRKIKELEDENDLPDPEQQWE